MNIQGVKINEIVDSLFYDGSNLSTVEEFCGFAPINLDGRIFISLFGEIYELKNNQYVVRYMSGHIKVLTEKDRKAQEISSV